MKCFYMCIIKGANLFVTSLEMNPKVSFEFKDDLTRFVPHGLVNAAVSYRPHYLLMSNIKPLH